MPRSELGGKNRDGTADELHQRGVAAAMVNVVDERLVTPPSASSVYRATQRLWRLSPRVV